MKRGFTEAFSAPSAPMLQGKEFAMFDPYSDPFEDSFGYDPRDYRTLTDEREYRVLYFKNERKGDGSSQMQAFLRRGSMQHLFIPVKEGTQPKEGEVWLCRDHSVISEQKEKNFCVKSVSLLAKLFDGEIKCHFVLDTTRTVHGKHPWNAHQPMLLTCFATSRGHVSVVCTPDRLDKLPSEGHEFWVCRFKTVAHVAKGGNFVIAVMELLREDLEAREAYLAEQELLELDRRDAEMERACRHAEFLESVNKMRAEREAKQISNQVHRGQCFASNKDVGRGCIRR